MLTFVDVVGLRHAAMPLLILLILPLLARYLRVCYVTLMIFFR